MIVVAGEALYDLILDGSGAVRAHPGGGPLTAARCIARLGGTAAFLGHLSSDPLGRMLRQLLLADGVSLDLAQETDDSTPLALGVFEPTGRVEYRLYIAGTAVSGSSPFRLDRVCALATAIHIGSLALVVEPLATAVVDLIHSVDRSVLVLADPNCRPQAIASQTAYLARLVSLLQRTDVLKVSTEDLAYLYPDRSPAHSVAALVTDFPRLVVLLTDGPRAVEIRSDTWSASVDVPDIPVVDTIGAGDVFGAAFLACFQAQGWGRRELAHRERVTQAVEAAIGAAAQCCQRAGANPPYRTELRDDLAVMFARSAVESSS